VNDFHKFLELLDKESGNLSREPHVEQTEEGRTAELASYYYRYRDMEWTEEQARSWATQEAKDQVEWEKQQYGGWDG
jgi:hypothetical protein